MNSNIFIDFTKILIDTFFIPLKKSKTFLSYLFNHTLREELEVRIESGEIFPLNHINRSIRLAKKIPDKDFIIVDIGGGIGASVNQYNIYFPQKRIIVFEPILDSYLIIKSRFANSPNIEICNLAAGNENSKKLINIANRITSSSILPFAADNRSVFYNEPTLGQTRTENIEIVRLDDFLAKTYNEIGIMKIDVQGYEMNVLMGAEQILKRTNIVVLEVNNHNVYVGSPKYFEVDLYLREHDFTLFDIIPSVLDNWKLKEWDVIYISNNALCALV